MIDIFELKELKPMLIGEQRDAFDSPDYIYEIKLDGIRCIAYLDERETDLRNKREKKLLPHVPELSNIHKQVKQRCILDGELFIMKDGLTDFFEIQRRVLTSDPFKIRLASNQYPASFVAYDILYYKDELVIEKPLIERKELLSCVLSETKKISISRFIEQEGIQLFKFAKEKGLEGIVAKKKSSKYRLDKRTKDWIKCKVMASDDCVICGYIPKANNMTSLILGQYDKEKLVSRGHVTLGVGLRLLNEHKYNIIDNPPFDVPKGNEDAIWMAPELVCIVESMPTKTDSFRQPVFKGIRDDKLPKDCQVKPT